MKKILFLFPNQLFEELPQIVEATDEIALLEDGLFFLDHQYPVNFHRKKLILHRASMKAWAAELAERGYVVHYHDWQQNLLQSVFESNATRMQGMELVLYDSVDFALNRRLKKYCQHYNIAPTWLQSPLFLNSTAENRNYREQKKRWFMADFYKHQRRRLDILMQGGKPVGDKWSFDEENRKKIPRKEIELIPEITFPAENAWIREAREYVLKTFPNAAGESNDFEYPVCHQTAAVWFEEFLQQRFENFGRFEDALVPNRGWLYHSVLTPMLNIGLLDPNTVVSTALRYAEKNTVTLASTEGFIRQIIGWREFMRATYVDVGVEMRTTNHWNHTRKIPSSFYDASTGIKPIDDVIRRTLKTGYCHHIERLMVLGGFMFLCEFDPDEIHRWFMELFIDSYDWVMVPNVYAMSQYADGGLITTKPYFSGSNYLKKMGYDDFDSDHGDWRETWDGLYWRWIHIHQQELSGNPRWAMMCAMAKKMDEDKMALHVDRAEAYLATL